MVDNISLVEMEKRFVDVRDVMSDVRSNNLEYKFENGCLQVFLPAHVLVVECVDNLMLYSMVHKQNWNKFWDLAFEYSIAPESLACYLNANHWGSCSTDSLFSVYHLTMAIAQNIIAAGIDSSNTQLTNQIEPTIFGDMLFALVGVADYLPSGENGISDTTSIYGLFSDLERLRASYVDLRARLAKFEADNILEPRHQFAIHAFIPNRCLGFGLEVSNSFFIE